ncbi:MAG: zinc ABC transporter substrate-binding protein [Cyanobacteria bacterium J06634_5]
MNKSLNKSFRFLSKLTALSLTLTAFSCSTQPTEEQAQDTSSQPSEVSAEGVPQVVASYSVLCDLTEQIAQITVDVTCLIDAGQDPHVYSATPADRRAIEEAELVLYGGYEFEPEIIQMVEATDLSAPAVAISEVAVSEPLLGEHHDHGHAEHAEGEGHEEHAEGEHHEEHAEGEHHDHGHEEHAEGEGHEEHAEGEGHEKHAEGEMEADPHVWHDAENGVAMVQAIQAQLSEVSPENASLYESNAEALIAQLEQLDTWIQAQIDTVPATGRTLISTHGALGYYANAYSIELEPALDSFSTEARPSAADIKGLVDVVAEKNVPSIFVESTSNPGLIEAVSRETDIAISDDPIYADGLGEAGTSAESYQGMLVANTCTIVSGLGGTCDQAAAQDLLPAK